MARQIERANNLARILDVTTSFERDGESTQPWQAILALYSEEEQFAQRYDEPRADDIIYYLCLDEKNPNSILSNISFARENARALRPLLATELWTQINVFCKDLEATKRTDLRDEKLSDFCARIILACQTHAGLVEETLFRDEEWYFYGVGLNLERADQTTRLVDVKYHLLLPKGANVGSSVDVSQWNAVLRSAAGFQAYRRVYHRGLTGEKVANFLLLDERLPRSVRNTTGRAAQFLETLVNRYDLPGCETAVKEARALADQTATATIDEVVANGMHQWIDDVQCDILAISAALSEAVFPEN